MPGLNVGGIQFNLPDSVNLGRSGGLNPLGNADNAHIAAQNDACAELASIVFDFNNLKQSGNNTDAQVQNLVRRVNDAVARFAVVVNQVGTTRAQRGLADIQRNANAVIASFSTISGGTVTPAGTVIPGGQGLSGMLAGMDVSTLLLIGAAAWFLLGRRR